MHVTNLDLCGDASEEFLGYWLNNIVENTFRELLTPKVVAQHISDLRENLLNYKDISRALVHSEFPPPMLPADWLDEAENWFARMAMELSNRSNGGGPKGIEQMVFLPRALGLFFASFGCAPDSSVSWQAEDGTGAAFRFIQITRELINERTSERKFSRFVTSENSARARWHPVADETMRKRLQVALGVRMKEYEILEGLDDIQSEPGQFHVKCEDFAWRIYGRRYRSFLRLHSD